MAIYSNGALSSIATTTAPSLDIKASSINSPRLMEFGISLGAATASTYGFGRPANTGSVAQSSPSVFQAEDPADPASQTNVASTWTTAPTVPTVFLRRIFLPATVGAGVIWTFPRGLRIEVSGSLVNWNIAASAASYGAWAIVDE